MTSCQSPDHYPFKNYEFYVYNYYTFHKKQLQKKVNLDNRLQEIRATHLADIQSKPVRISYQSLEPKTFNH